MLESKRKITIGITAVVAAALTVGSTLSFAKSLNKGSAVTDLPSRAALMNANSNRYSKPEKYTRVQNRLNLEGFVKILEDEKVEVWHRDKNASIRIVDKATGYIWGGLTSDKPENMNTTWSGVGNSLVSIDYFDKKGIEKRLSIADAQVDKNYAVKDNVLTYSVTYKDLGISFDFTMELKDGKLTFRLEDDTIKEEKDNYIGNVYFVPFLGSTVADEIDGYMFVPDGPGALIRFSKPSQYLVNFDKRVYGKDYGIDKLVEVNDLKSSRPNDFATEEPTVLMPVFGVVHGVKQNALFATINEGAEYASIMATPSGMLTNYNWVTAKFTYRQKYLQPTSRSGSGVQIMQEVRNSFDAAITYNFLNGEAADYVGMAKFYRESLKQAELLPGSEEKEDQIPLQVDIIAADIEKGFLFNSLLKITTPDETKAIIDELAASGIVNSTVVVQGWQKGGVGGSKPSAFNFESKLGGKAAYMKLADYIKSTGGNLYFYENPVTANKNQIDLRSEGGNSLSQALIKLERDNNDLWFKETYFVESKIVAEYVEEKAEKYRENNMKAMAINEFGSKLYAENQQNNVTTRLKARDLFEAAAEKVSASVETLALYKPNQYLWKYTDKIFDIPMVNSQYLFENDTVPFLQIVLKGSVDYYGPYINMSFYSKADLLKLIEYGAYPAYLLTGKSNTELKYTTMSELYSTSYEDWKDNIAEAYAYINKALTAVEGKTIENRTVLSAGVVKVDYDNKVSIVVNYTGSDYKVDGIIVKAQDYTVIGGE
ncbi:DUF5696 domain-containing protein [Clostridium thermarum]|uniref:DUF5696 domain-containing protein n=1 Tax=Clostridium thermarum TaxID=1716543 RepID=UPI00111D7D0D|nr:DUF5696 domain-containing protein [Clostridium thermarum]